MKRVIDWYQKHHREFPFRKDPTPYHIWISEIMLQQTRMETVIPYYERFIREVPDVESLSRIPEEKLLKLWEGLGYYTRARNLQKAARIIETQYDGVMPEREEELIKLPGIGSYTAAAITSMAFHEPVPVVDGNVLRVVSRFFMLPENVLLPETKKACYDRLKKMIREEELDAALFNQGIMELGEVICLPKTKPLCSDCPLKEDCRAFLQNRTGDFPLREAKQEKISRDLTVWIFMKGDKKAVVYRKEKDVLKDLYGYPVTEGKLSFKEAEDRLISSGIHYENLRELEEKKHVFTHRIWHMKAYSVRLRPEDPLSEFDKQTLIFASEDEIREKYPLPSAFKKWKNL